MPQEECMTDIGSAEDQVRRACRKLTITLRKTRRRGGPGSEHSPYHALEPIRSLAISAVSSNGMTLEEAEAYVEVHQG
jgi:hypothetical protein